MGRDGSQVMDFSFSLSAFVGDVRDYTEYHGLERMDLLSAQCSLVEQCDFTSQI